MSTSTILPVIHPVEGDFHVDSLARLHTAIADVSEGIGRLRKHADASTGSVLDEFARLHATHERQLVSQMAANGHPPGSEGTFHHLVESGLERLRGLFDGGHEDVLRRLLDEERQVIAAYNAALEQGGPPDTIDMLQRQREELGALVVRHDPQQGS